MMDLERRDNLRVTGSPHSKASFGTTDQKRVRGETSEFEIKVREVRGLLRQGAEAYRKIGIPVSNDLRVDERYYENTKGFPKVTVDADLRYVTETEAKFRQNDGLTPQEIENRRLASLGDRTEVIWTALIIKYLGSNGVYTVRASRYDDIANGVDNLVIDRKTNQPLCFVDEFYTKSDDSVAIGKRMRVSQTNKNGGVNVKYGFREKKGDKVLFDFVSLANVPVLCSALKNDEITSLFMNFDPNPNVRPDSEVIIMRHIFTDMIGEINQLLSDDRLPRDIKARILIFKKVMEDVLTGLGK